jgi:hypothetical protein
MLLAFPVETMVRALIVWYLRQVDIKAAFEAPVMTIANAE